MCLIEYMPCVLRGPIRSISSCCRRCTMGLLLKMGEKNSDGGQFYTPRELIRAMVRVVDPKIGQTVCDPCCGTGGFLAESAEHMRSQVGDLTTEALYILRHRSFYGREKDNLAYPIALA